MFQSILVPLDGSTFGEHALPVALGLARKTGAAIQLLHVHNLLEATYAEIQVLGDSLDSRLRRDEQAYLDATAQKLRAAGASKVAPILKEGRIVEALREHALASKTDLIVMTTHARGALGRFWLGSATDELLRDLPCPLLLVHPESHAPDLAQPLQWNKILVPLDGTPLGEQILPATALAQAVQAEFVLLRVIQSVVATSVPIGIGTIGDLASHISKDVDKIQADLKKKALEYLTGVATRLRQQGFTVATHAIEADQTGVGILAEAKQMGTDVIAMETHGRHGLSRLVLGSVTDKVLRGSHLPLLLHKPKAH